MTDAIPTFGAHLPARIVRLDPEMWQVSEIVNPRMKKLTQHESSSIPITAPSYVCIGFERSNGRHGEPGSCPRRG